MRQGARIGVDVGTVRVGVSACDPSGLIATPVVTLLRGRNGSDLDALSMIAVEREVIEIVVGLPTGLSGRAGRAAEAAVAYAQALAARVAPVTVRLFDERFSTASAARNLRASGRDTRSGRAVIDQAAAVIILQSALDAERMSGLPTGQVVPPVKGETQDDDD